LFGRHGGRNRQQAAARFQQRAPIRCEIIHCPSSPF
jgi:hypothetical protein